MLNLMRGEAALGDATLVFDIDAFVRAEDDTGLETQNILTKLQGGVSVRLIRSLVWAGMIRNAPNATVNDATALIEAAGLEATIGALGTALAAALPSAEGKAKPARKPAKPAGNGNSS